jgi:hypothetical protein
VASAKQLLPCAIRQELLQNLTATSGGTISQVHRKGDYVLCLIDGGEMSAYSPFPPHGGLADWDIGAEDTEQRIKARFIDTVGLVTEWSDFLDLDLEKIGT